MKTQNYPPHYLSVLRNAGLALLTAGLVTVTLPAGADELRTPVMQQGSERGSISMPSHGQSREKVETRYGQPQSIRGPVGEPPITQWIYSDFIVYFENNHVIHAVKKPESE